MAQEEPTNYQFAGTGIGLQYIGNWAYGYSGTININDETKTMFDFHSGSGVILAKFTYGINLNVMYTSKFIGFIISLNDVIVFKSIMDDNVQEGFDNDPIRLVIPPLTHVKIESITDSATDNETYGILTGRVYGIE